MTFRHLQITRAGGVERVTLHRPEVRNAFNDEVVAELASWASRAAADAALRAVVLAGEGPAFCAGADISWMARTVTYSEEENERDAVAMSSMFEAVDTLPVPVIGRVQGAALGGGTGLAAVCDIVIASDSAVFGFTEVRLGILPAVISPFAIAKIGVSAARELMLTGARFGAVRAREIGLVHTVVPEGELDATVDACVADILSGGPVAVRRTKRLIRDVAGRARDEVRPLTARAIASQRVSPEGQQGLRAFLDKRRPEWAR